MESGPFIQTVSGRRINPLEPSPDDVDICDIARALSNQCRFGGNCRVFYCPTPEERVLTADLRWVPAGDLVVGDQLLAFDELPFELGSAAKRRRRYRHARVRGTTHVKRRIVRLEMADGATVRSSLEHPWLVATKQSRDQRWLTAGRIAEDIGSGRCRHMHRFLDVWGAPSSWREDWFAGMLDGEGYLSIANRAGVQFGVSQRSGSVCSELENMIAELGFSASRSTQPGGPGVVTFQIKGGWREIARFMGSTRPMRLVEKFRAALVNGNFAKQMNGLGVPSEIIRSYDEGEDWVTGLETSTHTYLCEGFAAHNSVAQHSCLTADLVAERGGDAEAELWALLHDASEAYLVDLPHPLKHRSELGRLYTEVETVLQAAICRRFRLLPEAPPMLKPLDRALLATERRAVAQEAWHWPELEGVEPLDLEIEPWLPDRAYAEFLARYERAESRRRLAAAS